MSPTLFLGRVVLPAIGLCVAVGVTWHSFLKVTARPDVISRTEPARSATHASGQIVAEGRIVAYPGAQVTVGTEVLGTIINMPARETVAVRKGDLLAELRSDDVKAALREAHFRVIEAETGVRLLRARFQLDRIFPAVSAKIPATAENRVDEYAAAQARRDAAKAAVDRLEAESAKYKIYAPIDGVVIERHANPGETVTPGSSLATIVDLSRLRVEVEVDEFDIARVKLGAKATIAVEGYPGHVWQSKIEEIADAVVPRQTRPEDPGRPADTRVLRVRLALLEPNPFKLGQHVEVDIFEVQPTNDGELSSAS
jgi:HlyD family secretion protein